MRMLMSAAMTFVLLFLAFFGAWVLMEALHAQGRLAKFLLRASFLMIRLTVAAGLAAIIVWILVSIN